MHLVLQQKKETVVAWGGLKTGVSLGRLGAMGVVTAHDECRVVPGWGERGWVSLPCLAQQGGQPHSFLQ